MLEPRPHNTGKGLGPLGPLTKSQGQGNHDHTGASSAGTPAPRYDKGGLRAPPALNAEGQSQGLEATDPPTLLS